MGVKSLVHGLHAAGVKFASWDFSVATDGGSTYFTIDPMPNWSMLDRYHEEGVEVEKAIPEIWSAFRRDIRSARERETDFFIQTNPNPGDPGALGENGRDFMHVEIYYPKDSPALLASLNSLRELYAPSTPNLTSRIYFSVTGDDMPFVWFVRSAADRAQYLADEASIPAGIRVNARRLLEQAAQDSKHVQMMDLSIRPEFSYHVPQGAKVAPWPLPVPGNSGR